MNTKPLSQSVKEAEMSSYVNNLFKKYKTRFNETEISEITPLFKSFEMGDYFTAEKMIKDKFN